jgi:ubiquinone/menaquinone biosynthesis C-methylase UbiE
METPPRLGFTDVDRSARPGDYVRTLDRVTPMWRPLRQRAHSVLNARSGDRILDVGCGTGEAAEELAALVGPPEAGGLIVGIDKSETMLREARRRARGRDRPVRFELGDVYRLAFGDSSFDACRAERVFMHLERPERALAEMCRVARSGGRVVVAEPDYETQVVDAPDRVLTRKVLNHACDARLNGWIGRQLPRLFRQAGLTDLVVSPTTVTETDLSRCVGVFDFYEIAGHAREAGVVSAAEAAAWLAHLEEASRAGHFFAALTSFVVSGRKPSGPAR